MVSPSPWEVIYAHSLGVAVRLIGAGTQLKDEELDTLVKRHMAGRHHALKPPRQPAG